MKKVLFSFLLFFNQLHFASAQITFEKTYKRLQSVEVAQSVIVDGNTNFIVASGDKFNDTQLTRDFGIAKLNAYGDTIWYTIFYRGHHPKLRALSKMGNYYYVLGQSDDSAQINTYMIWLCKFDSSGQLIWAKYYSDPLIGTDDFGANMTITSNNKLLIHTDPFSGLVIIDSTGVLNVKKRYNNYVTALSDFQKMQFTKKNSIYYFAKFYYPSLPNFNCKIFCINEAADSIGSIILENDSAIGAAQLIKFVGSDYLITGYRPPQANSRGLFISRLDSAGHKIWNKKLPFLYFGIGVNYYVTSFANLNNGNTVLSGFRRSPAWYNSPPYGKAMLYCFNDNGDSLWCKFYSPTDSSAKAEFYDVIATPDSGMLAVGQIMFSNGQQKSYIVKLDANGNLYNPLNVIAQNKESYLQLYPNPAGNYTNIHYMGIEKNVELKIINLNGQVVYRQQLHQNDERILLVTEHLAPGFYVCCISASDQNLLIKKLVVLRNYR
ncbi:MAG: T9SS type A sorting domain-containing protein [Bacteroidetes bacterium]|nr:T9SS type A sorting domain-containing protein [Bacteroidota bacterium]MBK9672670.1 T9SS type A sorting domain-containing protein [Bacteroidota bacterium]